MTRPTITVINHGTGNLLSVTRALDHCGADVITSSDAKTIAKADRLILPGVGAFGDGMNSLIELGLIEAIQEFAHKDRPLLGICLGMQMLMNKSYEFGAHTGLELIAGDVIKIPSLGTDGRPHKIPHMGWVNIYPSNNECWDSSLLKGMPLAPAVYFVHSFYAQLKNETQCMACCDYDGILMPAVVSSNHIYGCQFHPEKSGAVGLNILKNFLKI